MLGFENILDSVEIRIIISIGIGLLSIILVYFTRRLQVILSTYIKPILVDIISSIFIVSIVLSSTIIITDIWGQTNNLLDQLGLLTVGDKFSQVIVTVVILISIQVFLSVISRLLKDLAKKNDAITQHQKEVSYRVSQLIFWFIGLVSILGIWEINISGLLIGAGFFGIIVGLAARKTLGSLLAGFTLMFSRPFEIGDWIKVGENEGRITDITMMNTRIKSFDGEYIIIPNDVINNEIVTNKSKEGKLRIEIEIGIDYDSDLEKAREIALNTSKKLTRENYSICEKPKPKILTKKFGDSSVIISVLVWIDNPSLAKVNKIRHKFISTIKGRFDEENIKIPFPQREISERKNK